MPDIVQVPSVALEKKIVFALSLFLAKSVILFHG